VAEIGIKEIQDYVGRAYDDMMNRLNDERDIGTRLKQMEEKFMALTEKYEEQEGEFKKLKKRMKEMEKKQ
jgi:predicted nuclease with TOPRIM domain